MNIRLAVLLVTLFTGVGNAYSATAQEVDRRLDFLFGSHQKYHDFLSDLQQAVAAKDQAKVATMIAYPLKVGLKGKVTTWRTPAMLQKNYNSVFTPDLVHVISAQKYEELFARDQGVMIGDSGQLWFGEVCQDKACHKTRVLITRINR